MALAIAAQAHRNFKAMATAKPTHHLAMHPPPSNEKDLSQQILNLAKMSNMDTLTKLSQSEQKVLWYVSQLKSVREISELLFISPNTVNNHEANIRHKLNISGANSLQQYALSVRDMLSFANGIVELKK